MRYALVEAGVVTNVIALDTLDDWPVPDGATLVLTDTAGPGWLHSGGVFSEPVPLIDLDAYARDKRWRVETGGITVAGVAVATDDRSKLMIMGARVKAEANRQAIEHWVAADGQIHDLDATAIVALGDAVAAHVSACFARYAAVRAAIATGTVTTTEAIDQAFADLTTTWPV